MRISALTGETEAVGEIGRTNRKSIRAWCDETEPPSQWKGASTAYRAGAKARASGKDPEDCRYGREDLALAWLIGFDRMDEFLSSGGILVCECCGQEINTSNEQDGRDEN